MFLKYFIRSWVVGVLVTSTVWANPIEEEWRYAVSRSLTYANAEAAAKIVDRALVATQAWFQYQKISFQRIRLDGAAFDSFLIVPEADGVHLMNRQAAKVVRALSVELVYSPFHLMRGADGFFSDRDQVLGISNEMMERGGEFDSTFFHEVIHAAHFRARMKGGVDPLSAFFQVVSTDPEAMISEARSGYRRLQTLEEVEAHVESLVRLQSELVVLKEGQASLSRIEAVLNSMYHTAEEGERLSKQSHQAILLTLDSPSWQQKQKGSTREIFFSASAHETSTRYRKIERGVKAVWRLSVPVSDAELRQKLSDADRLVVQIAPEFKAVYKSMYLMIERVDAKRTDLAQVDRAVKRLHAVFEEWKNRYSTVVIPKF